MRDQMAITLILLGLLGAIFLKGFKEAIGVAVILVALYLGLNTIVTAVGLWEVLRHPHTLPNWINSLSTQHSNALAMLGVSLVLFPKLALGLSGFETGVAVMPLIKGDEDLTDADWEDIHNTRTGRAPEPRTHRLLEGRIKNTRKLLRTAALIMSAFLITS